MADIIKFPRAMVYEAVDELAQAANDRKTYSNIQYKNTEHVVKTIDIADYMSASSKVKRFFTSKSGATLADTELFKGNTTTTENIGSEANSNSVQTNTVAANWAQQTKVNAEGTGVEVIDSVDQYTDDVLDSYETTKPTLVGSVAGALAAGLTLVGLGKTISSALYKANPDFWDSYGWDLMDPDTWEDNIIEAPDGRPTWSDLGIMTLLQFDYNGKSAFQYISEDMYAFITRGLAKLGILDAGGSTPVPAPSGISGVEKDATSVAAGASQNSSYTFYNLFESLYVYEIGPSTTATFKFVQDPDADKLNGYGIQIINNDTTNPLYLTMYKHPTTGNLAWSAFFTNDKVVQTKVRYCSGTLTDGVWSWGTKLYGSIAEADPKDWPNNQYDFTNNLYTIYAAAGSYLSQATFSPDGLTSDAMLSVLSTAGQTHVRGWAANKENALWMVNIMWNMLTATEKSGTVVDGVGNQTAATQLTSSDVQALAAETTDNATAVQILKGRFSDLWKYRLETSTVQSDGTTKKTTWIRVGSPNEIDTDGNPLINPDSEEGTAGSLQTSPEITFDKNVLNPNTTIDPSAATAPSVLNSILNSFKPATNTDVDTGAVAAPDPAEEYEQPSGITPDITGNGATPLPIIPSGSAGDLFTVYRPTAAELKALGAWLWSDNFVEQLKKVFSDPMQAIIGLHKVFIPPLLGGNAEIKVGYLGTGVSSDVIRQQYSEVNCGSVDLPEYFGNVFDYAPHTRIQLYLPFVGIVDLDPADVMRSTITVKYVGDAYSGSCIANVYVKRDGNECCMYTFTGNDAVQYPLSSGSYMGLATGVLGIAGGIATAMINPVYGAVGVVGSVLNAHTKVQHAGNLTGNAGAMGIKTPYLIITRPQTATAVNFPSYVGKPCNTYAAVSSCSGYTRIDGCQVHNINEATKEEKDEISRILSTGFLA